MQRSEDFKLPRKITTDDYNNMSPEVQELYKLKYRFESFMVIDGKPHPVQSMY